MTNLVIQKNNHDCVLASIAMAVGKSYEEAWTNTDIDEVVKSGGVSDYIPWMEKQGLKEGKDFWIIIRSITEQDMTKVMLKWRPAILSVASLNHDHGWHAVYWDGERMYDPSNKKRYEFLSSVYIRRVILLRPNLH